jgi:hypothetical protein
MSAAEALKAARDAGIELRLDGDDLVLEASGPPPAAVLNLLSRHKPCIVVLLRSRPDGWSAEDWQVFFDERAGIAEFDGGLPRVEAEADAFACCVVEWLNRKFVPSPPGRCIACDGGDRASGVPFRPAARMQPGMAGRLDAVAALAAMGIASPAEFPDDFGKNGGA